MRVAADLVGNGGFGPPLVRFPCVPLPLAACHRFRGGRALWVSPVGKPRGAGPVGKPCGHALRRGKFL